MINIKCYARFIKKAELERNLPRLSLTIMDISIIITISFCISPSHSFMNIYTTLLTKTTAAQNEDALSYHKVRGLYFLAVVFVRRICMYVSMIKTV